MSRFKKSHEDENTKDKNADIKQNLEAILQPKQEKKSHTFGNKLGKIFARGKDKVQYRQ